MQTRFFTDTNIVDKTFIRLWKVLIELIVIDTSQCLRAFVFVVIRETLAFEGSWKGKKVGGSELVKVVIFILVLIGST